MSASVLSCRLLIQHAREVLFDAKDQFDRVECAMWVILDSLYIFDVEEVGTTPTGTPGFTHVLLLQRLPFSGRPAGRPNCGLHNLIVYPVP